MIVSTCSFRANKSLINKSDKFQTMSQKRETKLPATIINEDKTTPSLKLITAEKIHHSLTNVLYSTSLLKDRLVTDYQSLFTDELDEAVNKMKEIMMGLKLRKGDDQVQELIMIDTIQRLGIDHYFRNEIHDVLKRHHTKCYLVGDVGDDLYEVSLRFRLLRQEGYNVPAIDTFARFKDSNGKFNSRLESDIKGLMSLLEASHLSIKGDDILDEAGEFSKNMLELYSKNNAQQLEVEMIRTTLGSPCQRSLPKLTAKNFFYNLETYLEFQHGIEAPNDWTNNLCYVAKQDLNMAQIIHQDEINHVLRWWKQLRMAEELKLARDQPVKWYIWSLVAFPNPRTMREERLQLTKQISFVYIMDDIFDVYGTLEQLTLFTQAVNRWDYGDQRLPEYMNMFLRVFYETINEISDQIYAMHGWDPKESIQKMWIDLCNAFLIETKWLVSRHSPTSEEYLKNGLVSSGSYVVAIMLFYVTGQNISHDDVSCWNNFQAVVTSTATILRLWDDLGSAKDEDQNGRDGSFIDFYMNEHQGCSIESAQDMVNQMILDAWKRLNEECMISSPISTNFKRGCLNLAKMVPMMYNYDGNQRLPDLERYMKSFLYETIP